MILLILFLVYDCSHGPVLLRAGAGRPCDAAQQGSSRNDQTFLHDLNCLKMKKIEKFFGLCLYFWRVPCPAWGWAARCRATWRTGCGWRPGRWRSGGRRPGWSRSPPPGTMVPAPCPHYLPGFCWFGSLDGCLTTKIFVYTKNICACVSCPVSSVRCGWAVSNCP